MANPASEIDCEIREMQGLVRMPVVVDLPNTPPTKGTLQDSVGHPHVAHVGVNIDIDMLVEVDIDSLLAHTDAPHVDSE